MRKITEKEFNEFCEKYKHPFSYGWIAIEHSAFYGWLLKNDFIEDEEEKEGEK